MLVNDKERKICEKYGTRDKNGKVHCDECPLNKTKYTFDPRCKAICHYDKHSRQWVLDGYWKDYEDLTDEERESVYYMIRPIDRQHIQLYHAFLTAIGKNIKDKPVDAEFMNAMENWYLQLASIAIKQAKGGKNDIHNTD